MNVIKLIVAPAKIEGQNCGQRTEQEDSGFCAEFYETKMEFHFTGTIASMRQPAALT